MKKEGTPFHHSSDSFQKQLSITNVIDHHLSTIETDTGLYSTHSHKYKHESFKELVNMGDKIVNYLFYLMFEHGTSWTIILLLNEIVKNKPVIPKDMLGKHRYITVEWMKWYLESDYYKNNDIYYNLV